jgi:hypothetical protein
MMNSSSRKPPEKLQFWVIWLAILGGVPFFIFFIGGGWPTGADEGEISLPLLAFILSGAAVSTVVRWAILPRMTTPESLMKFFVIGMALAEATALFGIFLIDDQFPVSKQVAYIASLLGMLQFIPTFANRLGKDSFQP